MAGGRMIQRTIRAAIALFCCLLATCSAQTGRVYTTADYAQAEKFMDYNVKPLIYHSVDHPKWLADGRFWYRDSGPNGVTYIMVDPAKHMSAPAFDHARVAAGLNAMSGAGRNAAFDARHLE